MQHLIILSLPIVLFFKAKRRRGTLKVSVDLVYNFIDELSNNFIQFIQEVLSFPG